MRDERWRCTECYWVGTVSAMLTAPHPFDHADLINGCPECRSVDSFEEMCDEFGCPLASSCGWPSAAEADATRLESVIDGYASESTASQDRAERLEADNAALRERLAEAERLYMEEVRLGLSDRVERDAALAKLAAETEARERAERERDEERAWREKLRRDLDTMIETHDAVAADAKELQGIFARMYAADMRGIKAWQEANPANDLVWPDKGNLVGWLLDQMQRLREPAKRVVADAKLTDAGWFIDSNAVQDLDEALNTPAAPAQAGGTGEAT